MMTRSQSAERALDPLGEGTAISIPDRLNVQLSRTWFAAWILAFGLALITL